METVADLVKRFMNSEMPVEQVWERTQAICNVYGIDPTSLDEANAQFIAGEIDKENASLAISDNSSRLTVTEDNGKKRKSKSIAANNSQAETLKPAVIGLRDAIESEMAGLSEAFDSTFTEKEKRAAQQITQRARQFAPNVVNYVAAELEGYRADSEIFHGQITGIIEEAFSGFLDD